MEIKVKQISKLDFENLNCHTLFEDKLTDKVFGVISRGSINYKFGWQSDTLVPFVLNLNESVCLIGIDQNLIILDFVSGKTIFKYALDYFFYDAQINNDNVYVITELEIFKINLISFSIINTYGLPDYFEKIEFKNGKAEIHCLGGETLIVE